MRIWSLHPKYLDAKGLVALWRETLLAKHVLAGTTKGYRNHPQLNRFKKLRNPRTAINFYLGGVYEEAVLRNYNFDKNKFRKPKRKTSIAVTRGQMEYEFNHLLLKLKRRDRKKYEAIKNIRCIEPHPLFKVKKGPRENWEVV